MLVPLLDLMNRELDHWSYDVLARLGRRVARPSCAAAVLSVQTLGTTRYGQGVQFGLIAFIAAVLGGIGNLVGAVIGGVLIGMVQAFNDGFPDGFGRGGRRRCCRS
jgi:hypothetical protein